MVFEDGGYTVEVLSDVTLYLDETNCYMYTENLFPDHEEGQYAKVTYYLNNYSEYWPADMPNDRKQIDIEVRIYEDKDKEWSHEYEKEIGARTGWNSLFYLNILWAQKGLGEGIAFTTTPPSWVRDYYITHGLRVVRREGPLKPEDPMYGKKR